EIRGGGDGSGRDTSGPEIAFRAIACGSTEVITHTTILARLRPARLMAGALLLREPTRKQLYCARAKQSTPISNPVRLSSCLRNCGTIRNNGNLISRKRIVLINIIASP
ncbi:hypothetical protein ALC60_08621, partial [Trachymyrmex zeteki]